ncbi:MAG: hypothetical protein IPL70_20040 [Uliginosibacterium sp.]|nr:hypothetical protein [Uliginosibacterium sp.]
MALWRVLIDIAPTCLTPFTCCWRSAAQQACPRASSVAAISWSTSQARYAWAAVWLEDAGGWVSFDVRRARLANGCQVRLAVGRDYLDACPMRAAHQGGGHEEVRVTVSTSS